MENNDTSTIIRRYLRYLKLERNYTDNTVEAYQRDLNTLLSYLGQTGLSPLNVRLQDLEAFAASLHEHNISAKSQARILSGVRAFYRFLLIDKVIDVDPTELLESPHLPKHLPTFLTAEEVDAMEDAIDLTTNEGHRNRAIVEVLFSCGLRVSELTNLKLSDLFLSDRFMRVLGKGRKERLVPMTERAVKELNLWFDDRRHMNIKPGEEDYVFLNRNGHHLTRTMILIMVKRLAEAAGIQKTISPHTLRHSFATALFKGGADLRVIQELLGHAQVGTTEIYTHLGNEQLRKTVLEHHPRNMMWKEKENDSLLPDD